MDIWNIFGDLIENLAFDFQMIDEAMVKQIAKFMSEKPESLNILQLTNFKGNALNEFTSTFSNVSQLTFSMGEPSTFAESKKLCEIFPNVASLYLQNVKSSDWIVINGKFAELTFIRLALPKSIDESHIISFLKTNRNIKKMEIQHASAKLLKAVSEIQNKLDELKIESLSKDYMKYRGDAIHFNTVKYVTIDIKFHEIIVPEKIVFDQLEELTLNVRSKFTDKWMKFVENQVNAELKSLKLVISYLNEKQLIAIPETLSNLNTVDIECQTVFNAQNVIDFVEKNQNAREINMKFSMNLNEIGAVQVLLNNWHVQITPVNEVADLTYRLNVELR